MTNEYGVTFYLYCKVLYEEVTEEFLSANYEIKNVPPRPRIVPLDLFPAHQSEGENNSSDGTPMTSRSGDRRPRPSFGLERTPTLRKSQGVAPRPRRNSKPVSLDEMDIPGTAYKRATNRAVRASASRELSDEDLTTLPRPPKSYFVPVAFCMRTKNSYYESAERLLLSLIRLLYKAKERYDPVTCNAYSYAEFVSHLTLLTNVTSPPPMTQLTFSIGGSEVRFTEGMIAGLPCEADAAVAHLFSLVEDDYIVALWTSLLLDVRVIIYASDTNSFFFVAKALNQLMFPFSWAHSKGIIPSISLLTQPSPYFYGTLCWLESDRCGQDRLLRLQQVD